MKVSIDIYITLYTHKTRDRQRNPFLADTSGTFGCGGFAHSHGWFQLQWPVAWQSIHIKAKELVPTVISAAIWGPQWTHKCIRFRSDNMAVVSLLKSRTSQDTLLMHMVQCLAFYAAYYTFQIMAEHIIPGILNVPRMHYLATTSHYSTLLFHRANRFPHHKW